VRKALTATSEPLGKIQARMGEVRMSSRSRLKTRAHRRRRAASDFILLVLVVVARAPRPPAGLFISRAIAAPLAALRAGARAAR
jgi:hypothetical protein